MALPVSVILGHSAPQLRRLDSDCHQLDDANLTNVWNIFIELCSFFIAAQLVFNLSTTSYRF